MPTSPVKIEPSLEYARVTGPRTLGLRRACTSANGVYRPDGSYWVRLKHIAILLHALDIEKLLYECPLSIKPQLALKIPRVAAASEAQILAMAKCNQLMSGRVKGASKFDAPILARHYYSLLEHGGLSELEWKDLIHRTEKYKR